MLDRMKTTIHHVSTCDGCRRTTVHQSVVEHGPNGRAVSRHHACEPCRSRVDASVVLAPVLTMITARSVRLADDLAPIGESHVRAIAN